MWIDYYTSSISYIVSGPAVKRDGISIFNYSQEFIYFYFNNLNILCIYKIQELPFWYSKKKKTLTHKLPISLQWMKNTFSARRVNKPHCCKSFDECFERFVLGSRHFTKRRYSTAAPSLSRFNDLWFIFYESRYLKSKVFEDNFLPRTTQSLKQRIFGTRLKHCPSMWSQRSCKTSSFDNAYISSTVQRTSFGKRSKKIIYLFFCFWTSNENVCILYC